jgi:tetratricopeptide (TPR) repeat protein
VTAGVLVAVVALGVPALVFVLWPFLRRASGPGAFLPLPVDARDQLTEQKRGILRALRELEFEHQSGHVSRDDYTDLRARYEADAAAVLTELDRLGEAPPAAAPAPVTPGGRSGWRHPAAVATTAVLLVGFGAALGAGIVRYTEPDPAAGLPQPGSRPLASLDAPGVAGTPGAPDPSGTAGPAGQTVPGGGAAPGGARAPLPPEVLQGMLQAARASLAAQRYGEAIAAYQAVLKRDPKNVDAMTHLGLIVALGGHADAALETFDRALAIQPDYPPALLYRGQVLLESKQDREGAIRSWERFLAVASSSEERERVAQMIAAARSGGGTAR